MPGLPRGLFEVMARALDLPNVAINNDLDTSRDVDTSTVELIVDETRSGPDADGADPFTSSKVDLGVMCAPPYLALRSSSVPPPVALLGIAPVFDDPRADARPVYFADVVVHVDHPAGTIDQLTGVTFGYNDASSLSGLLALQRHLGERFESVVARSVVTGSHDASLVGVAAGTIDMASIDSNTLRLRRSTGDPAARAVRVIASLGPYPIQPVVARTSLDPAIRAHALEVLSEIHLDRDAAVTLGTWGCLGFAPVEESSYDELWWSVRGATRR